MAVREAAATGDLPFVRGLGVALEGEVKLQSFTKNIQSNEIVLKVVAKIRDKASEHELITRLSTVPGCKDIGMGWGCGPCCGATLGRKVDDRHE